MTHKLYNIVPLIVVYPNETKSLTSAYYFRRKNKNFLTFFKKIFKKFKNTIYSTVYI